MRANRSKNLDSAMENNLANSRFHINYAHVIRARLLGGVPQYVTKDIDKDIDTTFLGHEREIKDHLSNRKIDFGTSDN